MCNHKIKDKKYKFYMNEERQKMCIVLTYCKKCGLITKEECLEAD